MLGDSSKGVSARKCAPHPKNVRQITRAYVFSAGFAQLWRGRQRCGYSSLVRIDETKTAGLTFNEIDRDEVLAAVRRRKTSCSLFPGIVLFGGNLLSSLIVNTYRNLFRWFGGANGEPVLVARVEIHRDEGVIVRPNGSTPMAIPDLETFVGKCSGNTERGFACFDFSICLSTGRNAGGHYKDRQQNPQAAL